MEFKGMLRRIAGAGVALAAVGAMLIAPVSATAAPAAQDEVGAAGIINILHASTRRCLDANSAGAVYTHNCNGGNNQKWNNYVVGTSGKFKNVATGECLAAGANSVFTLESCTSNATDWRSTSGSPKWIWNTPSGKYLHNAGGHGEAVGLKTARADATRWSTLNA
jgi:Ricin-type beta-trefoil lectin domain